MAVSKPVTCVGRIVFLLNTIGAVLLIVTIAPRTWFTSKLTSGNSTFIQFGLWMTCYGNNTSTNCVDSILYLQPDPQGTDWLYTVRAFLLLALILCSAAAIINWLYIFKQIIRKSLLSIYVPVNLTFITGVFTILAVLVAAASHTQNEDLLLGTNFDWAFYIGCICVVILILSLIMNLLELHTRTQRKGADRLMVRHTADRQRSTTNAPSTGATVATTANTTEIQATNSLNMPTRVPIHSSSISSDNHFSRNSCRPSNYANITELLNQKSVVNDRPTNQTVASTESSPANNQIIKSIFQVSKEHSKGEPNSVDDYHHSISRPKSAKFRDRSTLSQERLDGRKTEVFKTDTVVDDCEKVAEELDAELEIYQNAIDGPSDGQKRIEVRNLFCANSLPPIDTTAKKSRKQKTKKKKKKKHDEPDEAEMTNAEQSDSAQVVKPSMTQPKAGFRDGDRDE